MNSEELLAETETSEDQQGWLATFADLMSLLMCFFVLLLSFSELDVIKFKQIAGSMKSAFGVQHEIPAEDIPKGTSVIAQEFSAATPSPSLLDEVKQSTTETAEAALSINTPGYDENDKNVGRNRLDNNPYLSELHHKLQNLLVEELRSGQFELDRNGQQLVIRLREDGTFASGSGFLQPLLVPRLRSIASLLADIPGKVLVTGHTDNIPLKNELFEDNLELSAARALAVARVLKANHNLRFVNVMGASDSQPLVANSHSANRARNRRVEISIQQGDPKRETLSLQQIMEKTDG